MMAPPYLQQLMLGVDAPSLFTLALCALFAAYSFLRSLVDNNYSHTDRLWSITPAVYSIVYAIHTHMSCPTHDDRALLMAALAAIWAVRLTYNFARRGGYAKDGEDYRWAVLKQEYITNPVAWQLFNLTFIAGYQHILLWLIATPSQAAYAASCAATLKGKHSATPALNALDAVATIGFLTSLLVETIADEQQWHYYAKRDKLGFNTKGLFSLSRHPNFAAEQAIWWFYALFAAAAAVSAPETDNTAWYSMWLLSSSKAKSKHLAVKFGIEWLKWPAMYFLGAFLLTLLFQGSARFTESITCRKYKAYASYQRQVAMFVPWPWKLLWAGSDRKLMAGHVA